MKQASTAVYRVTDAVSSLLNRICSVLTCLIGAGMVFCVVWGVFTRYCLGNQAIWTEEIARFLLVWLTFIGCSVAWRRNNMVRVTFLLNKVTPRGRQILEIVCTLFVAGYLIFFLCSGQAALLIFKMQKESITKISMIWPALGLYIGAVVMVFHCVPRLMKQLAELAGVSLEKEDKA